MVHSNLDGAKDLLTRGALITRLVFFFFWGGGGGKYSIVYKGAIREYY